MEWGRAFLPVRLKKNYQKKKKKLLRCQVTVHSQRETKFMGKLWKRQNVNDVSLLVSLLLTLPSCSPQDSSQQKKQDETRAPRRTFWKIFKIPSSKDHGMPLEELQNHSADTSNHEMGKKRQLTIYPKWQHLGLH